jgi:hypothetical protein
VNWFRSKSPSPESVAQQALAAELPPPMHPACTCGSRSFTAGGPAVRPLCDGRLAWVEPSGAVLSCLACGKRWYTTPEGLREPHPDAMPPAWAMQDLQREAAARQSAMREDRDPAKHAPKRPLDREFRRPPRPV